jgi:hypothetical protein
MGAAREHGRIERLNAAGIHTLAAYQGGPAIQVRQRRRRLDPATGRHRSLSRNQEVNTAHARLRGPGERANAQLKSWKVLRRILVTASLSGDLGRLGVAGHFE